MHNIEGFKKKIIYFLSEPFQKKREESALVGSVYLSSCSQSITASKQRRGASHKAEVHGGLGRNPQEEDQERQERWRTLDAENKNRTNIVRKKLQTTNIIPT